MAFRSRTWLWVIVAQWSLLCLLVLPAYVVPVAVVVLAVPSVRHLTDGRGGAGDPGGPGYPRDEPAVRPAPPAA